MIRLLMRRDQILKTVGISKEGALVVTVDFKI